MQIIRKIPDSVIIAATGMLQPFIPELNPKNLIAALSNHENGKQSTSIAEKPLTRKEAAALLGVSLPTISRYLHEGKLGRIRLTARAVRISPESLRNLLQIESTEA